jgi:hypothetical protein
MFVTGIGVVLSTAVAFAINLTMFLVEIGEFCNGFGKFHFESYFHGLGRVCHCELLEKTQPTVVCSEAR